RRGRPGEAGARARLFGVPAGRTGLAAPAGAARAVGRGQVQLAGAAGGVLVVLDAGDHRLRAAGLVLVSAILGARRGGLGMAVAMPGLARRALLVGGQRRGGGGRFGFQAQALGFLFLLALALGGFLGAALVLFGQALLLGQVAQARFLELAQDLGALVVAGGRGLGCGVFRLGRTGLDQGDLLAHDDVHR